MPDVHTQFSAQTIGQGTKARGQHRLDVGGLELHSGHPLCMSIDGCAQGVRRTEAIDWTRYVDSDGGSRSAPSTGSERCAEGEYPNDECRRDRVRTPAHSEFCPHLFSFKLG